MNGYSFGFDTIALLTALVFLFFCYLAYLFKKRYSFPQIFISTLNFFDLKKRNWKERLAYFTNWLRNIAFLALLIAFIDPKMFIQQKEDSNGGLPNQEQLATEGIALYFVLDQSGSMAEKINIKMPNGSFESLSKIELLKQATLTFIKGDKHLGLTGRPNDLIGIVEFARTAKVAVPLTLNRSTLFEKIEQFDVVKNPDEDGTAIGYAIYKTAHLIAATKNYARDLRGQGEPAYEIKGSAIILATDGLQDPNPLDKDSRWRQIDPREAAAYAKEQGIKLYIVNVDPKFNQEKYAPHRRQMEAAAKLTGGEFYMVDNSQNLPKIYAEINTIEKSSLPIQNELTEALQKKENRPDLYKPAYFAPFLMTFALVCLLAALFLECTLLKRVP